MLQQDLNVHLLLPKFAEFLSTVETCAPQPIAESARDLNAQGTERWQDLLTSFWQNCAGFSSPVPDTPKSFWRGFFCSLKQSTWPITMVTFPARRLWRSAPFAPENLSWVYCDPKAMGRSDL